MLHDPRGIARGEPIPLAPGHHPVGREVAPEEGIALADPRASRTHATLHVATRTQRVRVTDEDSRNGTQVNGAPIEEAWLEDGDVVRFADSHFLFRLEPRDADDAEVPGLLGRAPAVRALRATVQRVARHAVTVLITGESGTGKEVVARALHALSGRPGAFVAVNCAAIPEQLAESQLFGHVAGAFTGAKSDSEGYFRAADGGTIFLDEIGDLPLTLQPKLLRVIEDRAVMPVGMTASRRLDVRVVVATHVDLASAIDTGGFRGDLYARIAELLIALPPLRERREDVLPLLEAAYGDPLPALDPELVAALLNHRWPYNVRELRAVAQELRVRAAGAKTLGRDLVAHRLSRPPEASSPPLDGGTGGGGGSTGGVGKGAPPSRHELESILADCKGNVRAIARRTGRSRMQVYRWLEQYGLDLADYRDT